MSAEYTEHVYQEYHCKGYEPIHQREEIVRCKDCDNAAHFYQWLTPSKRSSIETWTCRNMEGFETDPDGFCAWGERKRTNDD